MPEKKDNNESTAEAFTLTPENYYSDQANINYLSNSTFKAIYGYPANPNPCEAAALYAPKERTEALLIGGYVDAAFESDDALQKFIEDNRNDLTLKSGKAFYKFVQDANVAIERAKRDKVFMDYLEGDKQAVMTGKIAGHPFRIKMDAYVPGKRITDLKYVKDAAEYYVEPLRRRATFIESYGYALQGAIYREIVRQNTGQVLPFYIAYITKEDVPDIGVVEIPDDLLYAAIDFVRRSLEDRPLSDVRANPRSCNRRSCQWCRDQLVLQGPYTFKEFEDRART